MRELLFLSPCKFNGCICMGILICVLGIIYRGTYVTMCKCVCIYVLWDLCVCVCARALAVLCV